MHAALLASAQRMPATMCRVLCWERDLLPQDRPPHSIILSPASHARRRQLLLPRLYIWLPGGAGPPERCGRGGQVWGAARCGRHVVNLSNCAVRRSVRTGVFGAVGHAVRVSSRGVFLVHPRSSVLLVSAAPRFCYILVSSLSRFPPCPGFRCVLFFAGPSFLLCARFFCVLVSAASWFLLRAVFYYASCFCYILVPAAACFLLHPLFFYVLLSVASWFLLCAGFCYMLVSSLSRIPPCPDFCFVLVSAVPWFLLLAGFLCLLFLLHPSSCCVLVSSTCWFLSRPGFCCIPDPQ